MAAVCWFVVWQPLYLSAPSSNSPSASPDFALSCISPCQTWMWQLSWCVGHWPSLSLQDEGEEEKVVVLIWVCIGWKQATPELQFCAAEWKDWCKSAMFVTRLSNTSRCCSFVCQPGKEEAFHRSPCRNPPSLKTRRRPRHTDQRRQNLKVSESKPAACRNMKTDQQIWRRSTYCTSISACRQQRCND